MRRLFSAVVVMVVVSVGLVASSHESHAQSLPLKRPHITALTLACPVFPSTPATQPQLREEANRVSALAEEAVLEGDHKSARDLFSEAAQLDRHDATLAYKLGREDEAIRDSTDAIHEYCRYLSMAADAGDASQVSDRLTALLPSGIIVRANDAEAAFTTGMANYDSREWTGAIAAFTTVMLKDTALADAVFDRALARDAEGDHVGAIRDFTRYLALAPDASDASLVRERMTSYKRSAPNTGRAVLFGVLPGGGQFYTGQPVLGLGVLAVAATGVALAIQSTTVTGTKTVTYNFPFGGTYQQNVQYSQVQHQNSDLGIGIAAGATVIGMVEAAVVAHRRSVAVSNAVPVTPVLYPMPDGRLAYGLTAHVTF